MTIRSCTAADVPQIFSIVNDAALAYEGIMPPDHWREPYMPPGHLQREIAEGVRFWGRFMGEWKSARLRRRIDA